jgi:hypothetical protein
VPLSLIQKDLSAGIARQRRIEDMKKIKSTLILLSLVTLLLAVGATMFLAAGSSKKDTLDVTAKTSNGGVTPTVPGHAPNQWFYAYCLPSGGSLTDSFPVDFKVTNTNTTSPESYTIHLDTVGTPAIRDNTTVPADFSISDDGSTTTKSISISTGVLADGEYAVQIQLKTDPPGKLIVPHDTIHVHVIVGAACSVGSCFLTDSDFNFLTDCSGADVTTNSGGTFAIVPNAKGKIVATNPGQFYYNLIWPNPGGDQAVTINLSANNLAPQGANAVHALTFNSSGFTLDLSAFDMVNQDGTPCGPSGPCTITVGAGEVLWVTWHLEYDQIGTPSIGILDRGRVCQVGSSTPSCSGRNAVSASGTVNSSSGATLFTCTASACGYLKR